MSFFYDLNKKLDSIRATPEVTHQQLNERDMSRAAKGYEKYGKQGMEALAKAGREGKALDPIRAKYDKYDNDQLDELSPSLLQKASTVAMKKFNNHYINANKAKDPAAKNSEWDQADAYVNQASRIDAGAAKRKGMKKGTEYVRIGSYQKDPNAGSIKDRRMPHGMEESGGPAAQAKPSKPAAQAPAKPSNSAPKGNSMGTIKGGVWTADPPKPGEKGVPAPSGDPEGVKEAGAPMTAKQKSFAKLAPPANKITFADKIAGAKKEVDEMLGDVAAEAMRSALGGGRGRNAEMDEGNAFDYKTPRKDAPRVGSVERGHKHDIKHTATGRMVTRRVDDQGNSVGADDADTQAGPRGRGRPKGTKGAIGAKGPSGRSKLMTKESEVDVTDQGEYDQEGDMAKNDIKTIVRHAQALSKVLGDNDNLPEWVQSKLAKIEGMMISVDEYMQNQSSEDEEEAIAEEPKSKNQAVAARIARGVQNGTAKAKPGSASAEMAKMQPKELNKFAKGSTKGLPKKVSKNKAVDEADENSDDGRLITKQTGPGQTSTSSSTGRISATVDKGKVSVKPAKSGGISYGQGIYDSMNHELELMIAESMSINMSDSTEGGKSLTITATDEDALKLGMLLKNAGLGGGDAHGGDMHSSGEQPCATCGMPDCGCGDVQEAVDENSPDWPTNTETSPDALQYAGGLNKPKTDVAGDGQTTIPNTAVHTQDEDALRRMMEMAGLAEAAKPDFLDMDKDGDKEESMKKAVDDKEEDSVEESIQRMREIAGIKEAKKPDFLDMDKDGDKKEPMSKAIKDKEEKKVDESIFALTNQWRAYKG